MVEINRFLTSLNAAPSRLYFQHALQPAASTSTEGLIALMLGKMGMTVDEYITQCVEPIHRSAEERVLGGR